LDFNTDDRIEDNENKFCSLWTKCRRIDSCANLFLNSKFKGDYFFNRLNNVQTCDKIECTLDTVSKICSKERQDVYIHIPYVPNNYELINILLKKGFRYLDTMYVLMIRNHHHAIEDWHKHRILDVNVKNELDIWTRAFCESFSIRSWKSEVSKIINRNISRFILIVTYIAEKPEYPVGCMLLHKYHGITGLYCLGTLKPFRRRGIATKMIKFATCYKRKKNTKFLIAHSLSNDSTINLYKNLGFEVVQVKKIFVSKYLFDA
jgi:ribosomal protein S18 acetylase RimI-like enzyme